MKGDIKGVTTSVIARTCGSNGAIFAVARGGFFGAARNTVLDGCGCMSGGFNGTGDGDASSVSSSAFDSYASAGNFDGKATGFFRFVVDFLAYFNGVTWFQSDFYFCIGGGGTP